MQVFPVNSGRIYPLKFLKAISAEGAEIPGEDFQEGIFSAHYMSVLK
jgi:hypothetical protein